MVVGPGPVLRQVGLGIAIEGRAISGKGVLEQLAPFFLGRAPSMVAADQIRCGLGNLFWIRNS